MTGRQLLSHPVGDLSARPERRWLVPGQLTAMKGDPGLGKSTVALEIASRVSTGRPMPDDTELPSGNVILLSSVDGLEDTVIWRLMAAEADLAKVYVASGGPWKQGWEDHFAFPADLDRLEVTVRQSHAVLVVIDVLGDYRAQHSAGTMTRLRSMAKRTGAAVLDVGYFGKAKSARIRATQRPDGSISVTRTDGTDWLVVEHPAHLDTMVLAKLTGRRVSLPFQLVAHSNGNSAYTDWIAS
jgi:RecA-family ATPase